VFGLEEISGAIGANGEGRKGIGGKTDQRSPLGKLDQLGRGLKNSGILGHSGLTVGERGSDNGAEESVCCGTQAAISWSAKILDSFNDYEVIPSHYEVIAIFNEVLIFQAQRIYGK